MFKIVDVDSIQEGSKEHISLLNYVHVKPKWIIVNTLTNTIVSAWYTFEDAIRVRDKLNKDYLECSWMW